MASSEVVSGPSLLKRIRQYQAKKRKTFILPTRFGLAFGAMALVSFFMAVGYSNNLIFIFVFLLVSMAISSAVVTNKNIQNNSLKIGSAENLFVAEKGNVNFEVMNHSKVPAWELEVLLHKSKEETHKFSVNAQESVEAVVEFFPEKRGWVMAPRVTLQSSFPFQLLRAWQSYQSSDLVLVFAARKGDLQLPQSAIADESTSNAGLFRDHRGFQSSDPITRIDWRASARRQTLFVKNYEEAERELLSFNWVQTSHLSDFESRVSQMTLWVDQAFRLGYPFSLQIGGRSFAQSTGQRHWHECLEALAVLQESDLR